jgi:hypothetical protein
LPAALYLLDPSGGAVGLARQLTELPDLLGASPVTVVDVGGDIVALGDEPGLRSPLADSLVLAALAQHPLPVGVIITGAGLDGELPPDYVHERCTCLAATHAGFVGRDAVTPVSRIFEWHLSETTGLLAAVAMGARGRAQIQAGRSIVELTPTAASLHRLDLQSLFADARLAQSLRDTFSLDEAQQTLMQRGVRSEIEYEHEKAKRIPNDLPAIDTEPLIRQVDALTSEAAGDSIDFLTLRRLFEALTLGGPRLAGFQKQLRLLRPLQYAPPVWVIRPDAWPIESRPWPGPDSISNT